jgi:hypothetical protein
MPMSNAVIATHRLDIGMTAQTGRQDWHMPKLWLGYTSHIRYDGDIGFDDLEPLPPSAAGEPPPPDKPGDRKLDLDVRDQKGRAKFMFTIAADYVDHGNSYTVTFADDPFIVGSKMGPDLDGLLENFEISACRNKASFEFDTASLASWDIARHLRSVKCPVVRLPFGFNLVDSQFPFPGWMMPEPGDPVYDEAGKQEVEARFWHGGPHPPIPSFLVIPTAA